MHMQAHKLGIKYPKYAFLTYGTYEPQWWITQRGEGIEDSNECRPEEIAEVLEFSLAALHFPSESLSVTKNSSHKMVPEQDEVIQTFVDGQSRHSNAYYTELKFYHQCYDATLALAFALNRTIEGIPIISQCHEETVENNYRSISELGNNETNRHAKDQAEIHSENFEIGDFNFAVDVVAKLMKKHMEDTNFIGLSVCN